MRVVALALCALVGVAVAEPVSGFELRELIDGTNRAKRHEAAAELAARVVDQDPDLDYRRLVRHAARSDAVIAVLHDDPVVRSRLSAALIEAGTLTREAAARIPPRRVLGEQLQVLLAGQRLDLGGVVPSPSQCRIAGGDARGLEITCQRSGCRACEKSSPVHMPAVTTVLRVRVDLRWSLTGEQIVHENRLHPSNCFCLPPRSGAP